MRVQVEPLSELAEGTVRAWSELAERAAAPNPFSEPAIASPAAHSLEEGADVALLSVTDDDTMVFALPVIRRSRYRRFPFATIASWRHAHCCSGEPLIEAAHAPEAWDAVLDHVVANRVPWLVLESVPLEGEPVRALQQALAGRHREAHAFDFHRRAVFEKRDDGSTPDDGMSSKHRSDARRKRRGLASALEDEVSSRDVLRTADNADDAVESFLALEASGWKGREGTAMACQPAEAEFFRRTCAELHQAGRLEMWRLGTPAHAVAYACNVRGGDTVFRFKLCYDESFRKFSPGVLLELDMLDDFRADGRVRALDSCAESGHAVYEQVYPGRRPTATMLVAPSSLPGRAVAALAPRAAPIFRRARRRVYRLVGRQPPPDYGLLD